MHPYEMAATMRTRGQDEASAQLRLAVRRGGVAAEAGTDRAERRRCARADAPSAPSTGSPTHGRTEFVDWMAELIGTPAKEFPQFEAGLR